MSDQIQLDLNEEITELSETQDYYNRLKLLVESMESDVLKSNKGNKAAGVRLRKSLRHSKDFVSKFVKFTLESR
jgi:hypothetical protein